MMKSEISKEELIKEYMQDYIRLLSWEKDRLKEQGYDVHFQEIRTKNVQEKFLG